MSIRCNTYLVFLGLIDESDVRFIENAFFSEVGLSHGLPDLFTFSSTANEWS